MVNEEQRPDGEQVPHSDGPEAQTSGPQPQDEPLTVDDILGAEQSEAATQADNTTAAAGDAGDAGDAAAADAADAAGAAAADAAAAEDPANPYLEDLRRITAEYANYRKRTAETAEIERVRAEARVIVPLLGVLDDLDRAEAHGDLTEGSVFATIAQKLRAGLEKLGLEAFGEPGERFDPQHHEAIAQVPVPGTENETVLDVVERGYRLENIELRPAKVAVAVSADG